VSITTSMRSPPGKGCTLLGRNGSVSVSISLGLRTQAKDCPLRDNFTDALRGASISEDLQDALTGHAGQTVGRGCAAPVTANGVTSSL
jgi:hypothetical protein